MHISPVYHGAPTDEREAVEQHVYDLLSQLHISFDRVDTDAAFTMDDCAAIGEALGVSICKNLVLTPRNKSAFYLLAMPADKPFVTKDFSRQIGSSRLSFASEEDMEQLLGVKPGSASVLALMNDPENRVTLAMERSVYEAEFFGCHPCRNTSSLRLRTADILKVFLPHVHHEPLIVTL
jgi:Ala-tRNA(Pro) deacylase